MNTIFKFYLESWFLFAIASAVAAVELWRGAIRARPLRFAWQVAARAAIAVSLFTADHGDLRRLSRRVASPPRARRSTAPRTWSSATPNERAAFEWLNENVRRHPGDRRGLRTVVPGLRPRLDEHGSPHRARLGLPRPPAGAALARHQPPQGGSEEALHQRRGDAGTRHPAQLPHRPRLRRRSRAPHLRRRATCATSSSGPTC